MNNIRGVYHFINAVSSNIYFDSFALDTYLATTGSPFANALNTTLVFHNSQFLSLQSIEQNLIQLTSCSLSLSSSHIFDFNVTFISASASNFTVESSVLQHGGLKLMNSGYAAKATAGWIDCRDCPFISLSDSLFSDLSGSTAGVIQAVASNGNMTGEVLIDSCHFDTCSSVATGGAVSVSFTSLMVTNSIFTNNSATRGGALYFVCNGASQCSSNIHNNVFLQNRANEGACISWTEQRPSFLNNTSSNNFAIYGVFEGSQATHLSLAKLNETLMRGVGEQWILEPIQIVLRDAIDQIVATDNSTQVSLSSPSLTFLGSTLLTAQSGIANFSALILDGLPGALYTIEAYSSVINASTFVGKNSSFDFNYWLRDCVPGEIASRDGCYPCPNNSYSLDPSDNNCLQCPDYGKCYGGANMTLNPGYWRNSSLSYEVYACPIASSCANNSTCAEGYEGRLCGVCTSDFYKQGLYSCYQCEHIAVITVRMFSIFTSCLILSLAFVRGSKRNFKYFISLAIALNFLQTLIALTEVSAHWSDAISQVLSVNEMIASFALSSVIFDCLLRKCYIESSIATVYLNAVFASVSFPCLTAILSLNWFFSSRQSTMWYNALKSVIVMGLFLHPYILKTIMTLVACKPMESGVSWLLADLHLQCWDSTHMKYVLTLFLPLCIVYVIAFPCAVFLVHWRFVSEESDPVTDPVLIRFRSENKHWNLILMLRKEVLIIFVCLMSIISPKLQILSALVLFYLNMEAHLRYFPYEELMDNLLEAVSIIAQFGFFAGNYYSVPSMATKTVITDVLGYIGLAGYITFILLVCFSLWMKWRQSDRLHPTSRDMCSPPSSIRAQMKELDVYPDDSFVLAAPPQSFEQKDLSALE